ncbi:antitoxin HicB [Candidatus Falkowbacteria bacterium CG11_big_fil_rev_8_21_14_0_20_39_10]|uniref:Antitoxin HicB n=1 Tax=Candidatus Falkowbacteria bacterium CG11_big_fil_rev_8_21_14_0_20_39_10 TaxID=1974570 RepID=A0A2M6K9W1_9BACT|nr:MAG: antitoxin HicB [Candidatus Falkowbacteria bacterium CG11_big_fil_rev_8_21_14_0_20_39_10]
MPTKKIKAKKYSYTIIYEPIKEGGYQAIIPILPGLITYGRDLKEAKIMAKDAIKCYLESLKKEKEKIPVETSLLQERLTISFAQ